MKMLVAIAEHGRTPVGMEMVRVPSAEDCTHNGKECLCRIRWVSTLPGGGRWALARVVDAPTCFDLAPRLDTPEVRRMFTIAHYLAVGTQVRLIWRDPAFVADNGAVPYDINLRRIHHASAYDAFVVGPH